MLPRIRSRRRKRRSRHGTRSRSTPSRSASASTPPATATTPPSSTPTCNRPPRELEVPESAAGYARLHERFDQLLKKHGRVHFHVRLDVAGAVRSPRADDEL